MGVDAKVVKNLKIAKLLKEVIAASLSKIEHIGEGEQTMREVMQLAGQQSLVIKRDGSTRFREMGLMIGSGVVASGCKQIVTQRLKLPGAE